MNASYAQTAQNNGYLDSPALFLNARYDYVCECTHSRLAEPMRAYCSNLQKRRFAQAIGWRKRKPAEVNAALVKWLATKVPEVWPQPK